MYVFLLQDPIRQTMVAPDQVQYYFQLAQHHAVTMQQQVKILLYIVIILTLVFSYRLVNKMYIPGIPSRPIKYTATLCGVRVQPTVCIQFSLSVQAGKEKSNTS